MRRDIQLRVRKEAEYIVRTGATVRVCARQYGVSKSTIHMDMRERLPELDRSLADAAAAVLDHNRAQRHLRGGLATREKYRAEKYGKKTGRNTE